jgi:hypothetical protein
MPTRNVRQVLSTWSASRKLASAVLAVVLLALLGVRASRDSGGAPADRASQSTGGSETNGSGSTSPTDASAGDASAADEETSNGVSTRPDTTPLPLASKVSNTTGLRNGDEVKVDATAESGSLLYGVEMRLCKEGTIIANDGDLLPTVAGQCASEALSPGGDGYKIVASEGDRTEVHTTYTVSTGTNTFPLDAGGTGSVTCDADHPCVLAVKYQIPDGFGFRTYPLTFAS